MLRSRPLHCSCAWIRRNVPEQTVALLVSWDSAQCFGAGRCIARVLGFGAMLRCRPVQCHQPAWSSCANVASASRCSATDCATIRRNGRGDPHSKNAAGQACGRQRSQSRGSGGPAMTRKGARSPTFHQRTKGRSRKVAGTRMSHGPHPKGSARLPCRSVRTQFAILFLFYRKQS